MIITCWSPKAGSGTSVVAATLAGIAARSGRRTLLVDFGGDSAAILGLPTPALGLGDVVDGDGGNSPLEFAMNVGDDFDLVAPGLRPLPSLQVRRWDRVVGHLVQVSSSGTLVIVDTGCETYPDWLRDVSDRVLLVIRPCYVALRRAVEHHRSSDPGDGIIVVSENDRALTSRDVSLVVNRPVVAEVPVHHEIARRVDSGLLNSRIPERLVGALSGIVKDAS